MSNLENGKFFDGDYFSYESNPCFCGVDTTNISPGVVEHRLKIQAQKDIKVYFAFGGEAGLCRTTENGSLRQENLLKEIVSLPNNDIQAMISFFETNGFFFKVGDTNFESLSLEDVIEIINRLKATVALMNEIESPEIDYERMISLTLYLLLSQQISIELSTLSRPYVSCKHFLSLEIEKASQMPEIDGQQEAFQKDTYTISDSIYSSYELDIEEYNDVVSGNIYANRYPGYLDMRYKSIVYLYRNGVNLSKNRRYVIDFLFHFMRNVGVVGNVSFEHGIEYYSDVPQIALLDEKMKNCAVVVAKIILNEEMNHNLSGISPRYSVQKMGPTWRVPNLISALYFSVFYLRPGTEIYRKCANPACNNRGVGKTTNGRKEYCCANCRNATAQRNHRKKIKSNKT